ncbi:hypothetical protein HAX54_017625 [Datura stramonium]|uniref:Uncharacterized protein n=1 Tax=Datura stramonium TaxID=4076 RepID=A0ABS8UM94_DATST|nr:hypothetical protein [Datura stramonium]
MAMLMLRNSSRWPGDGRSLQPSRGRGSHFQEMTEMQTVAAHLHPLLLKRKTLRNSSRWPGDGRSLQPSRGRGSHFQEMTEMQTVAAISSIVEKGHFVVYTTDQARFSIPLAYLLNEIIRQLLNMSEEEFGLPSGGPITLPCDKLMNPRFR